MSEETEREEAKEKIIGAGKDIAEAILALVKGKTKTDGYLDSILAFRSEPQKQTGCEVSMHRVYLKEKCPSGDSKDFDMKDLGCMTGQNAQELGKKIDVQVFFLPPEKWDPDDPMLKSMMAGKCSFSKFKF